MHDLTPGTRNAVIRWLVDEGVRLGYDSDEILAMAAHTTQRRLGR